LNQRWPAPLRLQASHCSTFRIVCDVPSIAVFCTESIECFPGIAPRFFLKFFITIPVAPIIIIILLLLLYYYSALVNQTNWFKLLNVLLCTQQLSFSYFGQDTKKIEIFW
jgi:hypothetical protein